MKQDFSLNIVRYDFSHQNLWNHFVNEAKNSTFLFRRNFMEYHKDRFEDFSLLFFKNEELVGILPANIDANHVFSHQGLTYGGLLVKSDCKFALYKKLFTALIEFLKGNGITYFSVKPIPSIYGDCMNDEFLFLQQFYSCTVEHTIGSVVGRHPIISKSIYRNAKNALKKGIEIRKSNDFDFFWNHLLTPRLQSRYYKKPVHTLEEIKQLKVYFENEIELYGAFLNNEMVAGTVLFQNKHFTKSQYIASNGAYNKLGGLDLLHLKVIENLTKPFFDFGTSSLDVSAHENDTLLAWKEQFGARTVVFSTYTFNLNS